MPRGSSNTAQSHLITFLHFSGYWFSYCLAEVATIGLLPSSSWANPLPMQQSPQQSVQQSMQQQVATVAAHLIGVMSTTAQAQAEQQAVDVTDVLGNNG
ncbi:hypothetical protein ACN4EG_09430 [Alkalinema pantanalense CENA528]|uniref:hypothetical protein n=1 Tax=Alkalinema pantanalense TaxID=1620705 RepID=UPI003D6E72F3